MNNFRFYLKGYDKNPLVILDVVNIKNEIDFLRIESDNGEIYKIMRSEIIYFVRGE